MGLHCRVFGLSKLRPYISANHHSIIINPFTKQSRRDLHDLKSPNLNPTTKFLLKRLYGNTNDVEGDRYLSVLSTDAANRISPEKNIYFRSPRAPPPCPFALFGGNNNTRLPFQPPYFTNIVNSCNGLVCLQSLTEPFDAILWNPLTDDFIVIDYSSIKRPRYAAYTVFKCFGFGFDSESKDYKVVVLVKNVYEYKDLDGHESYIGSESHYEVCSLKTGSWEPLQNPKQKPCGTPVYIDGSVYWITYLDLVILSFNFVNDKFSTFPVPQTGRSLEPCELRLVDYGGSLCCVVYPWYPTEKDFELWVWDDKDRAWTKVDSFRIFGVEKPLVCWGKDNWFFEGMNRELLLFDRTTEEVEHLGIYEFPFEMELVPFVESMTPPNGEEQKEGEEVDDAGFQNELRNAE